VPYHSLNPATGEILETFAEHTDQEMMNALAKADNAFGSWAARPIEERAKIIARAAQLLLEQKSELARLATLEMGKRIAESRGEVELSAAILQYFAENARRSSHLNRSNLRWEMRIWNFLSWAFS
jgi:succinate-semialdehyde dehydrogenase/glutarate-semialdehyde dehydrogenase